VGTIINPHSVPLTVKPDGEDPSPEGEGLTRLLGSENQPIDVDQRSLRYMMRVYGGFRGGARRLLAVSYLNAIGGGMAWFVLILYIYELFPHLGNTGVIFSIASWTTTFTILPGGWIVDRYDQRVTLVFSIMLGTVAMAMFAIAEHLWMILIAQVLNGAGWALMRPTFQAMMTVKTSDVRRKYLFSAQSLVTMVGVATASTTAAIWTSVGPDVFGLSLLASYRTLFMAAAVSNLVAILVCLAIRPGEEGREDEEEKLVSPIELETDENVARRRSFLFIAKFSTPMALIGFGAGFVVPFFQVYYVLKFDVAVSEVAWLFTATNVAMALSFFLVPNLAERRGSVGAVVATQGVAVANLAAIPFAPTFLVAAPFHLVRMSLMNASTPIQNSLMMGAVRPQDRGKATAIAQFIWNSTNSIGMMFSGYIMEGIGLDVPFIIAVSFYSVAVGMFWFWFRKVSEM
jgi:MFS family permease